MNPNPYIDEDLQALAEHARRFAQEKVAPGFLERDKTRVFDRALLREMGELGFICPELPEQFGGLGMYALKLYYDTEESREGVNALKEKRKPEFRKYAK